MLRFNRLNLKNLSKLPRDFSTAQPLNKNFAQRFQEFSVAYKESASMAINILGAISAICVGFATYSYFFEKFEAQRAHSLVLEAMLKSQEKLADERLKSQEKLADERLKSQEKVADERLKAQEKVADEKFKTTEEKFKTTEEKFHSQQEKLKAEALLLEEKLQAQKNLADEKLRAQEKLFEEKLKSITGKSATPPSI
jgi:cell division septum initiation protein DivIVA